MGSTFTGNTRQATTPSHPRHRRRFLSPLAAFRPGLLAHFSATARCDAFSTDAAMHDLMRTIGTTVSGGSSLVFSAEVDGCLESWGPWVHRSVRT